MATNTTQHHFLPHLLTFHHAKPTTTTTTVGAPLTQASTMPTTTTTTFTAEVDPATTTHHYISLPEFLYTISNPHPHQPVPSAHPAFDLVETQTAFVVMGDLAGLGPDEVVVEANDHFCTLTVSGVIPQPDPIAAAANAERMVHEHDHDSSHREAKEPVGVEHKEPTLPTATSAKGEEPAAAAAAAKASAAKASAAKASAAKAAVHYHVTERRSGPFHRQFRLPSPGEVDMAGCHASMHHGLLTVVVPKRTDLPVKTEEEQARARRLRIVAASFSALTPGMPIL